MPQSKTVGRTPDVLTKLHLSWIMMRDLLTKNINKTIHIIHGPINLPYTSLYHGAILLKLAIGCHGGNRHAAESWGALGAGGWQVPFEIGFRLLAGPEGHRRGRLGMLGGCGSDQMVQWFWLATFHISFHGLETRSTRFPVVFCSSWWIFWCCWIGWCKV